MNGRCEFVQEPNTLEELRDGSSLSGQKLHWELLPLTGKPKCDGVPQSLSSKAKTQHLMAKGKWAMITVMDSRSKQ